MTALLIIKIILIVLLIRIIVLSLIHLIISFYDEATKIAVDEILKDPKEYVRYDHICKFMVNMIWLIIFIKLLIIAFNGNIDISV